MKKKSSKCEICSLAERKALHLHHIIPQCDPRCTNSNNNLVTVCASCHQLIHRSQIICEGWYSTSSGIVFFWHKSGEPHTIREGVIFLPDGKVDIRN
jgi:hypothetical protein